MDSRRIWIALFSGSVSWILILPSQSIGKTVRTSQIQKASPMVPVGHEVRNAVVSGDDAIGGNPAFTEFSVGSGALGRKLELPEGLRLGGIVLSDINKLFVGGAKPGAFAANNLVIMGAEVDTAKTIGWKGGSLGVSFLQFNGQNTNGYAGSLPGYNSIVAAPPYHRTELYEYWISQEIVEGLLKVRVGKIVPSVDFNNVTRANTLKDDRQNIAALSSLLYTSIFVNPTLLGVIGGYYDPVFGVTTNLALGKNAWVNAGVYDGNKARGEPSGLRSPRLNQYVFGIAEVGADWVLGPLRHPGQFGIGAWHQSGQLKAPGLYENLQQTGATGMYLYGGQRIWAESSNSQDRSAKVRSVSVFYQYGINNSKTLPLPVNQFVGFGATAFSIFDTRPDDSFGAGIGLSFLNRNRFSQGTELMFQGYYQAAVVPNALYLQPTLTYIPTPGLPNKNPYFSWPPGMAPDLPSAFTGTLRLTGIF
jgi:porin